MLFCFTISTKLLLCAPFSQTPVPCLIILIILLYTLAPCPVICCCALCYCIKHVQSWQELIAIVL